MKNKIYTIITVLVIAFIAVSISSNKKTTDVKNIDMMKNDTPAAEIVVQENLEYYPGAQGYLAQPQAPGQYPGIVMIHENRGLRPEIKQTADELAQQGYMVLAVDLLGGVAEDQTGARELTAKFDQAVGVENMKAAVSYLRGAGAQKIASLGWCFGGKQSLEVATSGEMLDATIVYYGGGMKKEVDELAPITWPVLGIFGDQDRVIPVEDVTVFENSLNKLGIQNEVYLYPGVGHAFANPSGESYAPNETLDAWNKTLAFLQTHLK